MHMVSVDTPPVQDVIEDSLRVHDVVVARGEGARVLVVAAVPGQGGAGGVTGVVRVEARVTGYPEPALVRRTQVNITRRSVLGSDWCDSDFNALISL